MCDNLSLGVAVVLRGPWYETPSPLYTVTHSVVKIKFKRIRMSLKLMIFISTIYIIFAEDFDLEQTEDRNLSTDILDFVLKEFRI